MQKKSTSSKNSLTVSIVIPNWNGMGLLKKNLPSVIAASHGAQIIVTDDASNDDSVMFLRKTYPEITVIENAKQQGFSGNVNKGVQHAIGDIVILLNTDVRPSSDFLLPLISVFQSDPNVFAAGCLEESHEGSAVLLRGRGIAWWEKGFLLHKKGSPDASSTFWVAGGSAAFRKDIWHKLGGMDTLYNPFYWEDIDLSYRARKAGYSVRFVRESKVGHFHETGAIATSYTEKEIKRIVYRNQFLFLWKNIGDFSYCIDHLFWLVIRLIQSIFRKDNAMLVGFYLAIAKLPECLYKRKIQSALWKISDAAVLRGE